MIPKIIHYCWFGGNPMPPMLRMCIASWQRVMPDYEIKEWNEQNFDVHMAPLCHEAYEAGKWAFVADYCRIHALYTEGGIYMDTDVLVFRPFEKFLEYEFVSSQEYQPLEIESVRNQYLDANGHRYLPTVCLA